MRMVFNFKMSISDYRKMMYYRTFGISFFKRVFIFSVWTVFAVLFVCDLSHVIVLTRVVHVCALMVTIAVPASFITMEINVSQYKQAYLEGCKAERQIVVDEEGFTFKNRTTDESGFNPWSDITRLEEMKQLFVIQIGRKEAVILPKRGMGDHRKVGTFIDMAIAHIPETFAPLNQSDRVKKVNTAK